MSESERTTTALTATQTQVPVAQTDAERPLLELERVIEQGLATFIEVGAALSEIRERRLHLERGYASFETYCRARWGFDRTYASRLINASNVTRLLPIGNTEDDDGGALPPPANEAQARELAPLKGHPDALEAAWRRAVETAPGGDAGKLTARHLRPIVAAEVERLQQTEEAWRAWSAKRDAQEERVQKQLAGKRAAQERRQAEGQAAHAEREAERAAQVEAHGGPPSDVAFEVRVDLRDAGVAAAAPPEAYAFRVSEYRHPDGAIDPGSDWTWEARTPVERYLDAAYDLAGRIEELTEDRQVSDSIQHETDVRRESALGDRGPWMATLTEPEAARLVSLLAQAHARLEEALALVEAVRARGLAGHAGEAQQEEGSTR